MLMEWDVSLREYGCFIRNNSFAEAKSLVLQLPVPHVSRTVALVFLAVTFKWDGMQPDAGCEWTMGIEPTSAVSQNRQGCLLDLESIHKSDDVDSEYRLLAVPKRFTGKKARRAIAAQIRDDHSVARRAPKNQTRRRSKTAVCPREPQMENVLRVRTGVLLLALVGRWETFLERKV